MRTIEVTEEEYDALVATRKSKQKARDSIAADLLDIAIAYHKWLSDNGAGDTYTTFCEDFGYTPLGTINRSAVHGSVACIINRARQYAIWAGEAKGDGNGRN